MPSGSFRSLRGREDPEDDVATDVSRSGDWTDGLNMLREDGLHVATEETVHKLTEIRLKTKLLGIPTLLGLVRRLQIRISCSLICDGIYIGRMGLVFVTCDIFCMTANR